jgi:hypothetical protein
MNLLKEMFVMRIREMLMKQAAIIQKTKYALSLSCIKQFNELCIMLCSLIDFLSQCRDKDMLEKWRQNRAQRNRNQGM